MWQRLSDHASPVLVKEVRQALRGRMFAIGLIAALTLAVSLAAVSFLEGAGGDGHRIVRPIYTVLMGVLLGYVPFHAQQTMRQEDAEGARDLLTLSPLGVWRIVVGKLLAACVVAGLLLAAFLPFVVVIAQHPGVDTVGLLLHLMHVLGVTVLLSAIGVATGAAQATRAGRGASQVLLAVIALIVFAAEQQIAWRSMVTGVTLTDGAMFVAVGWLTLAPLAPLILGFAAAAIARDDRDVSHGLRIAWLVACAAAALMTALVLPQALDRPEPVLAYGAAAILAGSFVAGVVVSEAPQLDAAGRAYVRRGRGPIGRALRGLLTVGGGRGVALTFAVGASLALATLVGCAMTGAEPEEVVLALAAAVGMSLAFSVLPARAILERASNPRRRRASRLVTTGALLGLSVALPLVVLILSRRGIQPGEMAFSPLAVLIEASFGGSGYPGAELILWGSIGAFAALLGLPGAIAGVREAVELRDEPGRASRRQR